MRNFHFALSWLLALAAGCAANVRSTTGPGTNLSRYRSFGFEQVAESSPRIAPFQTTPAGQTVCAAVARQLEAKGLHAAIQKPDFVIAVHQVQRYGRGTVVVDFIDPATRIVFWRGTANAAVQHPYNPDLGKLSSAIDQLMQRYPALVASAGRAPPL
jgi:hypothetical protein